MTKYMRISTVHEKCCFLFGYVAWQQRTILLFKTPTFLLIISLY